MAGTTNRGKYNWLGYAYVGMTIPTNYYLELLTSATAPTPDTETRTTPVSLTAIAAGNGYSAGGYSLTPGGTDFDTHTEDDGNDRALVQLKDIVWTASGGPIPASGGGARYALLTDDNGAAGSRDVEAYFDLVSDRTVSIGQTLTLQDVEVRINES